MSKNKNRDITDAELQEFLLSAYNHKAWDEVVFSDFIESVKTLIAMRDGCLEAKIWFKRDEIFFISLISFAPNVEKIYQQEKSKGLAYLECETKTFNVENFDELFEIAKNSTI